MTITRTRCDSCRKTLIKPDPFIAIIVADGVYCHCCLTCLEKNISSALTGEASTAKRENIINLLLGIKK